MSEGKLFVILPAFNEAGSLAALLPEIAEALSARGIGFEILVVDDASKDATAETIDRLAQSLPVRRLAHAQNGGYGAALRTGFREVLAQAQPEDFVITMDADRSHLPEYLPALLARLQEGWAGVTASYTAAGAHRFGVPWRRRVMSAAANALFRLAYPRPGVQTYTNGFRGYQVRVLRAAWAEYGADLIRESDFAGGTELFLKVLRMGYRTTEVPFDLHYENRGTGSKIRLGRTIAGYVRLLFAVAKRR
jgi:dolichol-phosphate mannosyltransferase